DAATGEVTGYNGREKAPQGATADMLLTDEGKPLARSEAMLGGRATGVPGALSLLEMAHADHGDLPWSAAFEGAIALAREGYPLTGRTHKYIHGSHPQSGAPDVQAIFRMPNGELAREGDRFVNAAYADTLEKIARGGTTAFYDSDEIAGEIVGKTHRDPLPGTITRDDLRDYRALRTTPVCRPYRTYVVCVPPPPSSGVAVLQILGILEGTDIDRRGPDDAQGWFLFAEASRLAYADRDRYVADPDFVDVPVEEMLDPAYLARRRAMIGGKVMRAPEAGRFEPTMPGEDSTREPGGTTHFVIADAQGNVASMTTTIESYFGSGRTVGGFFLNNQLTDFAFSPVDSEGRPAANAVAGGKRPRSSMSPTIILDADGKVVAALGSPGGNAIIAYVAKTIVGMVDWGLSPQDAIALPNVVARGSAFRGERDRLPLSVAQALAARGVEVVSGSGEESGLHAIFASEDGFEGGADPRRDGAVGILPGPPKK
ncbi:MAG: gamma-glutamyltransferase family protein, partial [Citromicrobium sp.]|nr:gamma-glutamyltransferase family protein [Citromicrobium sp.]